MAGMNLLLRPPREAGPGWRGLPARSRGQACARVTYCNWQNYTIYPAYMASPHHLIAPMRFNRSNAAPDRSFILQQARWVFCTPHN